jgi:hypothetical protein
MSAKLLLDSLRLADGGKVVCRVTAPDGTVLEGVIEKSFFDEFSTAPGQVLTPVRQGRIVSDNLDYIEGEADKQWRLGSRELVIR